MPGGAIRIADIQQAVAERYRVPVAMMKAPSGCTTNERKFAWPRQVAMTLAWRLTDHSSVRIGQFFGGRDHATVLYAMRAVEKRRRNNPKLHQSLRALTFELVRHA
jgi:chromosomal replication initiator protein